MPTADGTHHGLAFGSWPEGMPEDPAFFRNFAKRVEDLGFDMMFCGDHVYHNAPLPECLINIMDMAAVTSRITLGSCVLQLPMRDPSVTAKQIATIDRLSGGRFIFGAGVGGEYEREWEAVDVERKTRGRRMDEYLEIMQRLWKGEEMSFEGEFRKLHDVTLTPKTAQPGGPPIWIGGRSDAAIKRSIRFNGWIGYASSVRRARESVQKAKEFAGGELPKGFRIGMSIFVLVAKTKEEAIAGAAARMGAYYDQDFTKIVDSIGAVGTVEQVRQRMEEFKEAGVTDFIWSPAVPAPRYNDQVDMITEITGVKPVA